MRWPHLTSAVHSSRFVAVSAPRSCDPSTRSFVLPSREEAEIGHFLQNRSRRFAVGNHLFHLIVADCMPPTPSPRAEQQRKSSPKSVIPQTFEASYFSTFIVGTNLKADSKHFFVIFVYGSRLVPS